MSATSPSSASNVVNSSCAIQAARSSQRHCVQYSISTRARRVTAVSSETTTPPSSSFSFRDAPDLARHLHDAGELPGLIVDGDRVADVVAREAALRAEAELIERHVAAGLIDAAAQLVRRLQLRGLGRDETEHDGLGLRHQAQRPAGAG